MRGRDEKGFDEIFEVEVVIEMKKLMSLLR